MQEVRRFKTSTVSRGFSVVAGFYRTAVIDGVLEHSPAEHAPGVRGKRIGDGDGDGLSTPQSGHAGVGTLVDTARHGEIRGPGPD
jgi:hypothetical protein